MSIISGTRIESCEREAISVYPLPGIVHMESKFGETHEKTSFRRKGSQEYFQSWNKD